MSATMDEDAKQAERERFAAAFPNLPAQGMPNKWDRIERALPTRSTLLPCPFCGSKEHRWGNAGEHIQDGWEVRCGGCPAEMWGPTKAEAEAAWNRRTP